MYGHIYIYIYIYIQWAFGHSPPTLYIPIYRKYIWPYMAKNMAKYLSIYGHIWPYIGHRLAINGLMRAAPIFFHRCQRLGRGAGGSAGGALASMKKKHFFSPVLIPKRPPGGQFFFLRSQPSELAQTRRGCHQKELDELV